MTEQEELELLQLDRERSQSGTTQSIVNNQKPLIDPNKLIFPRDTQAEQDNLPFSRRAASLLADVLDLGGRTFTQAIKNVADISQGNPLSLASTTSELGIKGSVQPGEQGSFSQDMLRSPGMFVPGLGGARIAAQPVMALGKATLGQLFKTGLKTGVKASIPMSTGQVASQYSEEGQVKPTSMMAGVAGTTLLGGGVPVIGQALAKSGKNIAKALYYGGKELGEMEKNVAKRIIMSNVKPPMRSFSDPMMHDGFKPETILEEKVSAGTNKQMAVNIENKLQELTELRNAGIQTAADKGGVVNANDLIEKTSREIFEKRKSSKYASLFVPASANAEEFLASTPFSTSQRRILATVKNLVGEQGDIKNISILDAEKIKEGLGNIASFHHGLNDAESTALENFSQRLYVNFKDEIAKQAPKSVSELNGRISNLLAAKYAVLRGMPTQERANLLDIKKYVDMAKAIKEGDIKKLAVAGGNYLLKSPQFAQKLYEQGSRAEQVPGIKQGIEFLGDLYQQYQPAVKSTLADLFKNQRGSVEWGNTMQQLNKQGTAIADNLGMKFNGIQEDGMGGIAGMMFTDPKTGSTIMGSSLGEMYGKLKQLRKSYNIGE